MTRDSEGRVRNASRRSVLRGLGATLATPWLANLAQPVPLAPVLVWVGLNLSEYLNRRAAALQAGYCFRTLSVFGLPSSPYYNAVMVRPSNPVSQHDYWGLTAAQFGQVFGKENALGYGPAIIGATGSAANPLFVAVFEPQNPLPLTYIGLASGSSSAQGTMQGANALARSQGWILRCAAAYGDSTNPAFAGVWVPNGANTRWNNDGLNDNSAMYRARLDAQLSGWCRLSYLAVNQSGQYLSCFADDRIAGVWYERHDLGRAAMDLEVQAALGRGFVPSCLQAAGANPASATYAAIFTSSSTIEPKRFAVQPAAPANPAMAGIDGIIMQSMQGSPVRDASLAIVHGTKLVYARGYTLAESDWPVVLPTTHFRMASVSKTVAALAIFQLIEERKIALTSVVQDILRLSTPTGSPPPDPQFSRITIQHLLEHTSGLYPGAANQPLNVRNAFTAAGRPAALPVSPAMTDSYIASLPLCASPPGSVQFYSNAGYYLLGRVVARLRGMPRAFDAYQQYLFNPLSITRIRPARSLIADQYPDEARYRDPLIPVYPNVMSDAQPLVPSVYGDEFLELLEGAAGLSGAATDIARLIAFMISSKDSPVLKRSTLNAMFAAGSALAAAQAKIAPSSAFTGCTGTTVPDPRAGYGFDWLRPLQGGAAGLLPAVAQSYYGQKGGSLNSSGNVLEFSGDWGFCMQWGGVATVPNNPFWYPDFPQIMNIAVANLAYAPDLFPLYGMPPL